MKAKLFYYTGLICLLSGCISTYEPVGVKDTAGILVVEGFILEEGTTITLKRTVKLNDFTGNYIADTSHVSVTIIDDRNNVIAQAKPQILDGKLNPGVYVTNEKFTFVPAMQYALDIKIENKHYRSAWVSPVITPEIDELSWVLNDDESMDFMVSTHDPENKILYHLWSVKEDWEIRSFYYGSQRYDPSTGEVIEQSLLDDNNTYYCWASDKSTSLLLGSSDRLTNSTIKDKKIYRIEPGTTRYSYLYSIQVFQYSLDKEAYGYFENLLRNIEENGSLFAPQPTEKFGNIRCLSDPGEPVIGYIAATKETSKRIYIDMLGNNLLYDREQSYKCTNEIGFRLWELGAAFLQDFQIYHYEILSDLYFCLPQICVDCRLRGGTKKKPDFWPNDHQ